MGCQVKIRASAASYKGFEKKKNDDNIYINGRFMYNFGTDNAQISIENNTDLYVFAVSDSMDISDNEMGIDISLSRELKKCHDKMLKSEEDFTKRVQQLLECFQKVLDLIMRINANKPEIQNNKPSFSGLMIQGNKACTISLGNSGIFILSNGNIIQLSADWKKTERLLKLGIITEEQAKILSDRLGLSPENLFSEIRTSDGFDIKDGDMFLLCTDGLIDAVEREKIYDILLSDKDTWVIANRLVKEAIDNKAEDNVTSMVISIEKIMLQPSGSNQGKMIKNIHLQKFDHKHKKKIPKMQTKTKKAKKYFNVGMFCIVALIMVILIARILSGNLKGIKNSNNKETIYSDGNISSPTSLISDNPLLENDVQETLEAGDNTGTEQETVIEDADLNNTINLPTNYKVKKGDTLYSISRKFYGDPEKYDIIAKENNITDPNKIQEDQILVIPKPD